MLVTLIVRLLPERLAEGELVGEVEHIYSGERVLVRDLGELAGFAFEAGGRERSARPSTSRQPGASIASPARTASAKRTVAPSAARKSSEPVLMRATPR